MIVFREIIATIFLCLGIAFIIMTGSSEEKIRVLIYGLICLALAYFIWPSSKSSAKERDNYWLEALIEFVIELPVEFIKFVFRFAGRLIGKSDGLARILHQLVEFSRRGLCF